MSALEPQNKSELDVSLESSTESSSDSSPDVSDVESMEITLSGLLQRVRGIVSGIDSMLTSSSGNNSSSSSSSSSSDESENSMIDMDVEDGPNGLFFLNSVACWLLCVFRFTWAPFLLHC